MHPDPTSHTPHPTPCAGHAEAGRGAEGHGDVEGACRPSAGACPVRLLDVTGLETVLQPPRHRLGPGGDADLAVGRSNVGLDRVEAETVPTGDLSVGEALDDVAEDLGFTFG